MNQLLPPVHAITTVADLLHRLGDIPPERVWLTPTPGSAAEQDVIEAERKENRLCELIDGVLVEKTKGYFESRLALVLAVILEDFVYRHDLGVVTGADGTMRILPEQVRIPDVCFVAWSRLPDRKIPAAPIPGLVPDLAVEVLGVGNTKKEMERKWREYFKAGASQVWLVEGESREIHVYTSVRKMKAYRGDDAVPGGELLPGFELSLPAYFARVGQRQ